MDIINLQTKYQSDAKMFGETGTIKVTDIDSTSVKSFRWNAILNLLVVEFAQGAKYRYKGVDYRTVVKLLTTDSVGRTMNEEVKKHYEYEKI